MTILLLSAMAFGFHSHLPHPSHSKRRLADQPKPLRARATSTATASSYDIMAQQLLANVRKTGKYGGRTPGGVGRRPMSNFTKQQIAIVHRQPVQSA